MNTVTVSAKEILRETHEPDVRISLLQGLAKGEKMELIIQKAVEIGVVEIFPLAMDHSVVVLDRSKAGKKTERWQKIAEAAAKQSKRDGKSCAGSRRHRGKPGAADFANGNGRAGGCCGDFV